MAVREQVTIEVDVEGEGLRKLTFDAKKLRSALKGVGDESKKSGDKLSRSAELAERMRAALGPLGDVVGDVTGGFDDLGAASENFTTKQILAAGAVVAGVAALVSFGSAVGSVIANVDEYANQLTRLENRNIIDGEGIDDIRRANRALAGLTEDAGILAIKMAEVVAPAFENFARGAVYTMGLLRGGFDEANRSLSNFNATTDDALRGIVELGEIEITEPTAAAIDKIEEMRRGLETVSERLARLAAEEAQARAKAHMEEMRRIRAELQARSDAYDQIREMQRNRVADHGDALDDMAYNQARYWDEVEAFENHATHKTKQNAQKMVEAEEASLQERMQAVDQYASTYHSTATALNQSLNQLGNILMQNEIAKMKTVGAARTKALRRQFHLNKAMQMSQAVIGGALAFIQALSSTPPPASYVLAALTAAATAVQVGIIASQKPTFHRGGVQMAPDERLSRNGRAITRTNEAEIVVTAQGQRTLTDAINGLNRGDRMGGSGGVTVMLDSKTIRGVVHGMGQEDPAYGHRRRR